MRERIRHYRLPDGERAKNLGEYCEVWKQLGTCLEDIGFRCYGYDPRLVLVNDAGYTIQLDVGVALYIMSLREQLNLKGGGSWPWCMPCRSYHHPDNPTCKERRPQRARRIGKK